MGNENSTDGSNDHKFNNKMYDEFFINHHKLYNLSNINDVSKLNPERIVFMSIHSLYKCWRRCPSISLYNSIIIMPLKREWIVKPNQHHHLYSEYLQDIDFLTLLRWKDHQNMAIFLLCDNEDNDINILQQKHEHKSDCNTFIDEDVHEISTVWRRLSLLLESLHDPISSVPNAKYNPLICSAKYWKHKPFVSSMRNKDVEEILRELYTVTMKFKPMERILRESNPSLNVIINYTTDLVIKKEDASNADNVHLLDEDILDSNWWIAHDYYEDEVDVDALQELNNL